MNNPDMFLCGKFIFGSKMECSECLAWDLRGLIPVSRLQVVYTTYLVPSWESSLGLLSVYLRGNLLHMRYV